MGQAAHELRDLLSLARMLRRHVEQHATDANHDLFAATAAALEARARFMAESARVKPDDLKREAALYHAVDMRV